MVEMATLSDVADRLGHPVEEGKQDEALGLIEEASILVEGYLERDFEGMEVPRRVSVVVSRMVARVLQAPEASFSVDTVSNTAGPFARSHTYTTGGSGGSPWLTKQDKTALKRYRRRRGFRAIPMV